MERTSCPEITEQETPCPKSLSIVAWITEDPLVRDEQKDQAEQYIGGSNPSGKIQTTRWNETCR